MNTEEDQFLTYIGDFRIHDSKIECIYWEDNILSVTLKGYEGGAILIKFTGVQTVNSNRPLGMMLYAISEMSKSGPYRKFLFANWRDDDDASLEIISEDVEVLYSNNG
ncbi:hypothetical protein ACYEXS_24445 [Paenibacillus sp. MAH-36]|uniref:Uncharacterized protein n=1 Tax=Paenibacillus violae TaxID=3077234 RepID=A0ABU3RCL6_9BACL|nr:hypothetical protein [Paenibacillus sp. PFR10]MDU0202035.1 hypothetical protein [Paenibacillus sp. PFR10]